MAVKLLSTGIIADPEILGGKPVIRGTRVPVSLVVAQVANTLSAEEAAATYDLTIDQVQDALQYAAMVLTRNRTRAKP